MSTSTPRRSSGFYHGGNMEPPFRVTSPRQVNDNSSRRFLDTTISRSINRSPTKANRSQNLSRSYDSFDKLPKKSLSAGISQPRSPYRRNLSRTGSLAQSPTSANQTVLDDAAWMSERIYNLQKNGFFRYPAVSKLAFDRGASQPVTPRSDDYGRRSLWPSHASDYSRAQHHAESDAGNDELLSAFKLSEVSLAGDDDLLSDISSCTEFYTGSSKPDIAVQWCTRVGDITSQSSNFQSPSCSTPANYMGNENDNSGSIACSSELDRANSMRSTGSISTNLVRGDLLSRLEALQYRASLAVKESGKVNSTKIAESGNKLELGSVEMKQELQRSTDMQSAGAAPTTSQLTHVAEGMGGSMTSSEWPKTPPKPSRSSSRTIRPEYYLPLSSEEAFDEHLLETKVNNCSSSNAGTNWPDSKDGNLSKSPKTRVSALLEHHDSHPLLQEMKDLKPDQRIKSKHASPNPKLSKRVKPVIAPTRSPHIPRVVPPATPDPADGINSDQLLQRLRSSQNPAVGLAQTDTSYQNVNCAARVLNVQGNSSHTIEDRSSRSDYAESNGRHEDEDSWIFEENVESFLSSHTLGVKRADSLMSNLRSSDPLKIPTIEVSRKQNSELDAKNDIKAQTGNLLPSFRIVEVKEMAKADDENRERILQLNKLAALNTKSSAEWAIEDKSMQKIAESNVDECSRDKVKLSSEIAGLDVGNNLTSENAAVVLSSPVENNAIVQGKLLDSNRPQQIMKPQNLRETIISGESIFLQDNVSARSCFREITCAQADRTVHSIGLNGDTEEQKAHITQDFRIIEQTQLHEYGQLPRGYSIDSSCSTNANEDSTLMRSTSDIVSIYGNPLWIDDSVQTSQAQQTETDLSILDVESHTIEAHNMSLSFPKRSVDNVWNTYEGVAGFLDTMCDSSKSDNILSAIGVDHASLRSTESCRSPRNSESYRGLKELTRKDANNIVDQHSPPFSTVEASLAGPLLCSENRCPSKGCAKESQQENRSLNGTVRYSESEDSLEPSERPEYDSNGRTCLDDEIKSATAIQTTDAKERCLVIQTSGEKLDCESHSCGHVQDPNDQNDASAVREEVKQVTFIFPESRSKGAKEVPKNVETSNFPEGPAELLSCLVWSFFSNARKLGCSCHKNQEAKVDKIEKRVRDLEAEVEMFKSENTKLQKLLKEKETSWFRSDQQKFRVYNVEKDQQIGDLEQVIKDLKNQLNDLHLKVKNGTEQKKFKSGNKQENSRRSSNQETSKGIAEEVQIRKQARE